MSPTRDSSRDSAKFIPNRPVTDRCNEAAEKAKTAPAMASGSIRRLADAGTRSLSRPAPVTSTSASRRPQLAVMRCQIPEHRRR